MAAGGRFVKRAESAASAERPRGAPEWCSQLGCDDESVAAAYLRAMEILTAPVAPAGVTHSGVLKV